MLGMLRSSMKMISFLPIVLGPKIFPDFLSMFSWTMLWKSEDEVLEEKLMFKYWYISESS